MTEQSVNERSARNSTGTVKPLTLEARKEMIFESAYRLAEQRDFKGDCQLHDWLEAEARIDRIYGKAE
ncbi:MAG TPA: DUF2934 domain-containing protein [Mariprofundaceae bacterium]|nr:DUF2934 domain-containing protein [Mariprofundaceae bacterium]